MDLNSILDLALGVIGLIGLLPPVRSYFVVARRRQRADLISRLVLDGLALLAERKGISPTAAATAADVIEEIKARLLGVGVSRSKVDAIARAALAGAAAQLEQKQAARDDLLGG